MPSLKKVRVLFFPLIFAFFFSNLFFIIVVRLGLRTLDKDYNKSEDDIKALQSVGQVIGEVLKQLDDERCK